MDVCVLSLEEAGRLEHWGHWPTCKAHLHISKNKARIGAEAGEYRFLGGEGTAIAAAGPVTMVVPTKVREWKPVRSSNADGSPLMGMRTWGNAKTT